MSKNFALKEFVDILKDYMKKFGLYSQDVSNLAGSTRDIINGLESSRIGLSLKSLEAIANVFGLRYYEFGNPKTRIPKFEELPEKTIEKINWRKIEGAPEDSKYNKLDLKEKVFEALPKIQNSESFLPSEVFAHLSIELQNELKNASRITRLLLYELKEYVEKTGEVKKLNGKPGRPEEYYRLKKNTISREIDLNF